MTTTRMAAAAAVRRTNGMEIADGGARRRWSIGGSADRVGRLEWLPYEGVGGGDRSSGVQPGLVLDGSRGVDVPCPNPIESVELAQLVRAREIGDVLIEQVEADLIARERALQG